jgi:2-polyprenyl-3-methyl-5-hydroxy-6-metoxy-1,4-benzoquinol methylase
MPQTASQFHSQIANDFDALYASSPAFRERYDVWTALMDQYLTLGNRVLDLGCGSGVFSFYAAEKGCSVVGIDGAENMVSICEQRRLARGFDQVSFRRAEIPLAAKDMPSGQFEVVISSSVLEYVKDIQGALQNVADLIAPQGIFIISMPNKRSIYRMLERWCFRWLGKPAYYRFVQHVLTENEMDALLQPHGFERIDLQYYASSGSVMGIFRLLFPRRQATNLIVGVYQKSR